MFTFSAAQLFLEVALSRSASSLRQASRSCLAKPSPNQEISYNMTCRFVAENLLPADRQELLAGPGLRVLRRKETVASDKLREKAGGATTLGLW